MISWMGPGGDTITNDSRVMISPTSGSGNNYTSSLQFMYLMEGDEGTYECNVMILETFQSHNIELNNLTSKLQIIKLGEINVLVFIKNCPSIIRSCWALLCSNGNFDPFICIQSSNTL